MGQQNYTIDVKGLRKSFKDKIAVDGVSLQIAPGEIFGFLGPNGGGKTTTLRMLCGLMTPDAGEGHCLGFNVLTESYAIKCETGYMSQAFSLYGDLSVEENMDFVGRVYGLKNRRQRIKTALDELGLYERRKQLAGTLSGGWKQRLAMAAALFHQPKLLLLDEPTMGIDPKARIDFWDHLQQVAKTGITALVSTHYMDEAERCNRLAYFKDGKIKIHGTPTEIKQHAGVNDLDEVFINLAD